MSISPQPADGPFLRSVTVLPVKSIDEAAAWYRRALGFETVYRHEGDDESEAVNYAILRRDKLDVHLILDEPPPYRQAWTQAGVGYLYLIVRNVDEVFDEVKSSGVDVARGLEKTSWGGRGFRLCDPSGNSIYIEQDVA